MTLNFRKTLIAVAVGALMAAPVLATEDKRDAGATTGTSSTTTGTTGAETGRAGAAMGTPGAAGTASSPGLRSQGADTGSSTAGSQAGQTDTQRQAGQAGAQRQAGQAGMQQMDGPLYSRTADDLKGMDIVDQSGDDIGKVDSLVLGPDRQEAHVIVKIGGMLGMGGRDVMISLDQLQLEGDDKLRVSSTREQLEMLPEVSSDREDRYTELSGDRPLRESIQDFAAFEPGQQRDATPGSAQPSGQPGASGVGQRSGQSGTTKGESGMYSTPGAGQGTQQTPR